MTSTELIPLLQHMEWADARIWRAVRALPEAAALAAMRERLLHVHIVQRAFLGLWKGAPLTTFPQPDHFPTLAAWRPTAGRFTRPAARSSPHRTRPRSPRRWWFRTAITSSALRIDYPRHDG